MKKRLILISVLVLVTALVGLGIWRYKYSHSGERLLNRIRAALRTDPETAYQLSKNYTQSNPDDHRGWNYLGEAALMTSKFDEGHEAFETGLEKQKTPDLYIGVARSILIPTRSQMANNPDQDEIRQVLAVILDTGQEPSAQDRFKYTTVQAPLKEALERASGGEGNEQEQAEIRALLGVSWLQARRAYLLLGHTLSDRRTFASTTGNEEQVESLNRQISQVREKLDEASSKVIEYLLPAVEVMPDSRHGEELIAEARETRRLDVLEKLQEVFAKARENGREVSPKTASLLIAWQSDRKMPEASPRERREILVQAIEQLRELEEEYPNSIEPRLKRAEYHLIHGGQIDQAAQAVDWVLAKNQKNPSAVEMKIQILLQKGQISQAADEAVELATENPRQADYQFLAGLTLYRNGKINRAMQKMDDATQLKPHHRRARAFIIEEHLRTEQNDLAYQEASAYYNVLPNDSTALEYLVRTALRVDRKDVALDALEEALIRQKQRAAAQGPDSVHLPTLQKVWKGYIAVAGEEEDQEIRQRHTDRSLEAARLAANAKPETDFDALWIADAKLALGLYSQAENEVTRLIQANPQWAGARRVMFDVYDRSNRPMLALEQLRKAVELSPLSDAYLMQLARYEARLGMYDSALENIQQVLSLRPNHADAKLLREQIRLAQGQSPQLEDVVGEDVGPRGLSLARQLLAKGEYAKARAICQDRLRKESDDKNALFLLSQAYLAEGGRQNVEEACRQLAQIIQTYPEETPAYQAMAMYLGFFRDPPLSDTQIRQRFQDIPSANEYRILLALGDLMARKQLPDQAYQYFSTLANRSDAPDWLRGPAGVMAGRQLLAAGREDEGVDLLKKIGYAQVDWSGPARSDALLVLSGMYLQKNEPEQASRTLVEIKALCQRDPRLHRRTLGRIAPLLVAVGEYPKALEIHRLLADAFPTEAGAERLRAQIELAAGRYEQAEEAYKSAIAMQPTDLRSYHGLVNLFARTQQPKKLLDTLDEMARIGAAARLQAMEMRADFFIGRGLSGPAIQAMKEMEDIQVDATPRRQFILGRSYMLLGRKEDAIRVLEKIPPYADQYKQARSLMTLIPDQTSEKIRIARKLVAESPDEPRFVVTLMSLLMQEEEYDQAVSAYDAYVRRIGQDRPAAEVANLAFVAMLSGRRFEPAQRLSRDMASRTDSRGWRLRAALLSLPNEPAEAIELLPPVESAIGGEVITALVAARLKRDAKLLEAFHQRYLDQPARARDPLSVLLVSHLMQKPVETLSELPFHDRATSYHLAAWQEYLQFAKDNAQDPREAIMLLLAKTAAEASGMGRYGSYIAMVQLEKRPQSLVAAILAAAGDGRTEKVQAVLDMMADTQSLVGISLKARKFHQEQDFGQAIAMFEKIVAQDPQNYEMKLRLAESLEGDGKLSQALELYRQVYEKTGHPQAGNNGAYLISQLYGEDEQKLQEARSILEKMTENLPERAMAGPLLDTMGFIDLLLKQEAQALEKLRRAVKKMPGSIEIQAHLGSAEKLVGNYQLARWHLQAAIDFAGRKRQDGKDLTRAEEKAAREAEQMLARLPRS